MLSGRSPDTSSYPCELGDKTIRRKGKIESGKEQSKKVDIPIKRMTEVKRNVRERESKRYR